MLVTGIALANPDMPLRAIAAQLEQMRERTPRGSPKWSASSVKHLLDQAAKLGLAPNSTSSADRSRAAITPISCPRCGFRSAPSASGRSRTRRPAISGSIRAGTLRRC